jgi:transcriptional regulator with XRE-family HTH domain
MKGGRPKLNERDIVQKIKRIRINRKITLKELSKRTGLTEGYLSRIENSQNAPPVATLDRIAKGLNTKVSYLLFSEDGPHNGEPNIAVIKREKIEQEKLLGSHNFQSSYGYKYQPLAPEKTGKNMQPYFMVIDFEFGETFQHSGEEFFIVLDGKVEFLYGSEKYVLAEGDCVYFDAHIPHCSRSIGEKRAKGIMVDYNYKKVRV